MEGTGGISLWTVRGVCGIVTPMARSAHRWSDPHTGIAERLFRKMVFREGEGAPPEGWSAEPSAREIGARQEPRPTALHRIGCLQTVTRWGSW